MRLDTVVKDDVFEVKIVDRLSFSDSTAFRGMLEQVNASGKKSCVFDLSALTSIDSAGLGMFMIAQDTAKKKNWALSLRGAKGQVRSLLELGKFDKLLNLEA